MRLRLSPAAVACVAGGATMAVELLVPRLVARHVGTSVAVWTATIALVLAGIAAGAALGGRFADRVGPRRAQAVLAVAAALSVVAMPWIESAVANALGGVALLPRTLLVVAAAALVPALFLGGIAPAAAKEAADAEPAARGRALGRVAAAGSLGCVVGTWATGWGLVAWLPTSAGVAVAAAAIGICGAVRAVERPAAAGAPPPPPSARKRRTIGEAPATSRTALAEAPIAFPTALALAVLAGVSLLVVEVCALRRAATALGAGVATWTSVLAAVLAGASAGSLVGGRVADRRGPRAALGAWLLGASVLSMLAAWTPALFASAAGLSNASFVLRTGAGALLAWAPAAFTLGAIPPLLARGAVAPGPTEGRRLGLLSAAGTAGAVAGALLASPVLLPALGHGGTLAATSLALAGAALSAGHRGARPWAAGVVTMLACAVLPFDLARRAGHALSVRDDEPGIWAYETALQNVRVDGEAPRGAGAGRRVRRLSLDGMVHGAVDLDDPRWIAYGYEAIYDAVTDRVLGANPAPRTLFLGAGPYSFPRRMVAVRPRAEVTVVEIDPGVTRAAHEAMGLPDPPPMRIVHEDARTFVDAAAADGHGPRWDLVYGDAFQSYSVPFHLTTVEFARSVRACLAPGGAYVMNVIDSFDAGAFVGAVRATLSGVFQHVDVLVLATDSSHDRLRETFVVVASDRAIDLAGLSGAAAFVGPDARAIEVLRGERLVRLVRASRDLVLTDDYAPVENLLVPVAATR